MRILFIDDTQIFLDIAQQQAEAFGDELVAAHNVEQARRILAQREFDGVVCDSAAADLALELRRQGKKSIIFAMKPEICQRPGVPVVQKHLFGISREMYRQVVQALRS